MAALVGALQGPNDAAVQGPGDAADRRVSTDVAEDDALDVDDGAADEAAERLMLSVQRGFAAAKAAGVPAATRLMKELRQVCASGPAGCEVSLINDSLMHWQVSLFDCERATPNDAGDGGRRSR